MAGNATTHEPAAVSIDDGDTSTALQNVTRTINFTITCLICKELRKITKELLILQLILPIFTLIANTLTSVAIVKARDLKSTLRLSLLNLSFTDILASILYLYHIVSSWSSFEINIECIVRYALYVTTIVLTLQTIMFMSLDRFLSIFAPFYHDRLKAHREYVPVSILLTWIVTAVMVTIGFSQIQMDGQGCFYPLLMKQEIHLLYGLGGLTTTTTVAIFNALIFCKTRVQITKIAATLVGDERRQQIARMETKASMTTLSIVVPYVVMNCPIYFLMFYFVFNEDYTETYEALRAVNIVSTLSLGNSLINPSIYIWRSAQIRNELKKMGSQLGSLFVCRSRRMKDTAKRTRAQNCPVSSLGESSNGNTRSIDISL